MRLITTKSDSFKELKEIEKFLQESNTLEELHLRTALIKVPNYMYAVINNECYYFLNGKWHEDHIPFYSEETK